MNLWAAREGVINDVNRHINTLTNYYKKSHVASGISQKETDFLDDRIYFFNNLSSISCNRKNHKVVPMLKCFSLLDGSSSISVPVHYCETCHKYFIGIEVLRIYQKEYGDLLVLLSKEDLDGNTFFREVNQSFIKQDTMFRKVFTQKSNGEEFWLHYMNLKNYRNLRSPVIYTMQFIDFNITQISQ